MSQVTKIHRELAKFVQSHLDEENMTSIDLLYAMGYSYIEKSYKDMRELLDHGYLNRDNSFFDRLRAYFRNSPEFNQAMEKDEIMMQRMHESWPEMAMAHFVEDFKPQFFVHHEYKYTPINFVSIRTIGYSPMPIYNAEGISADMDVPELSRVAKNFIVNVLPKISLESEKIFGKRRYVVLWYELGMEHHKAIAFDTEGNALTCETELTKPFDKKLNNPLPYRLFPYVKSSTLEQLGITPPVEKHSNKNTGGGDYESI